MKRIFDLGKTEKLMSREGPTTAKKETSLEWEVDATQVVFAQSAKGIKLLLL